MFDASTGPEIDEAFEAITRQKSGAILVYSDPFFTSKHAQIALLGTKERMSETSTAKLVSMQEGLFRARSQRTYRFSSRPNSNWC
jgi:hypothetical protein